jgi:hypothetical protein
MFSHSTVAKLLFALVCSVIFSGASTVEAQNRCSYQDKLLFSQYSIAYRNAYAWGNYPLMLQLEKELEQKLSRDCIAQIHSAYGSSYQPQWGGSPTFGGRSWDDILMEDYGDIMDKYNLTPPSIPFDLD